MGEARDPGAVAGVGDTMREASLNPPLPTLSPTTSCPYPEAYSQRSIKDWNHEDVAVASLGLRRVCPLRPRTLIPCPCPWLLAHFHSAFTFRLKGHLLQEAALTSPDKCSGSSWSLVGPGSPPSRMSHAG